MTTDGPKPNERDPGNPGSEAATAQRALQEREEHFRSLIENAIDLICIVREDGVLTYLSPSIKRVLGYDPAELTGRSVYEFIPAEAHASIRAALQRAAERPGEPKTEQYWFPHKDRRARLLEGAGRFLSTDSQGRKQFVINFHDITARHEAEVSQKQSLSLLMATLESTADGILVVDNAGRIIGFNTRFAQLWRLPDDVLASQDDRRALAFVMDQLKQPQAFIDKVQQLYAHPEAESFDVLEFKDGRVFERYSRPQRIEGRPVGRVWSFRDTTERRRLEEQLRQAQKMEAIGQLAGGVAHDFNNILTAIMLNLGLLQEHSQLSAEVKASLKVIEEEAQRAANLTRQLLTFARRQVMQIKPLDLNQVLNHLLNMLCRLLGEHIKLQFEAASDLPLIEADPGMMEQMVVNLSINARDAMPKGGDLLLRTALVEIPAGSPPGNKEARPGQFVSVQVSDTGCGMSEATLERMFEPFFTTKAVGKGTGLGLATVYGIVKQHRGWTEVESQPGKGTTFRIFLPVAPLHAPEPVPPAPEPRVRGGHETILLVEDDSVVRQLVARSLRSNGYTVLEAASGREALSLSRERLQEIDLLLTDMVMPDGLTGVEVAEQLQAEKRTLKVIVSSGHSHELANQQMVERRRFTYLAKPYEVGTLAAVVRKCLEAAG